MKNKNLFLLIDGILTAIASIVIICYSISYNHSFIIAVVMLACGISGALFSEYKPGVYLCTVVSSVTFILEFIWIFINSEATNLWIAIVYAFVNLMFIIASLDAVESLRKVN